MSLTAISEVERFVRERFDVKEVLYKGSEGAEFSIREGGPYKEKFEELVRFLRPKRLFPLLRPTDGGLVLYVESVKGIPSRRFYVPILLFLATVATVIGDGWLRASSIAPTLSGNGVLVDMALYVGFVMAFLGVRYGVLYLRCVRSGEAPPIPYFIPGLPFSIPTFGAVNVPGEPPVNRDSEFWWGIWANLAGLAIGAIALAVGLGDTHVLTQEAATLAFGSNLTLVPLQVPFGLQYVIQTFLYRPPQEVVVLSPLVYAGWFCLLISLANMIPTRFLDGERTASSLFGPRTLSIAIMISLFVVVFVNFLVALFMFAVSWGAREILVLDRASKPSGKNVYVYAALMAMAAVVYLLFLYPPLLPLY
jgi:hypothetical protein